MKNKYDTSELKERLAFAAPLVKKNCDIVTPNDPGCEVMYHISVNNNIKEFTPVIGLRQGKTEDRTMPRVCAAPTVLGCILGYVALVNDMCELPIAGKKEKSYHGGWKIYGFEYEACLRPNRRLVYDADRSGECWLVSYNKKTVRYQPFEAGKFFWKELRYVPISGKRPEIWVDLYFEVSGHKPLRFSKNIILAPGHYLISGPGDFGSNFDNDAGNSVKSFAHDSDFKVAAISASEYSKAKKLTAGTLSYDAYVPEFINWRI